MSKECAIVKGTGIFLAVIGLASLAMADIAWFFGPTVDLGIEDEAAMIAASAAILCAIGTLELVCGILGVALAGRPKRLMPFIVAATILTLVNLFEVYLKIGDGTGGPIWVNLLYAAVAFTAIVSASRALKRAQDA